MKNLVPGAGQIAGKAGDKPHRLKVQHYVQKVLDEPAFKNLADSPAKAEMMAAAWVNLSTAGHPTAMKLIAQVEGIGESIDIDQTVRIVLDI